MVKEGEKAPDFELLSYKGERFKLSSMLGRPVVLFFYPKDDTPGCTRENCLIRDNLEEFEKRRAVVVGISVDDVGSHIRFAEKYRLTHLLLSDTGGVVSKKYGALGFSGRSQRKTFVIDEDGVIRKIITGAMPGKHVRESLRALDELERTPTH
ncbi:MAG: peroxiredoxin [Nitrososphaeria archaeon]|nr:peroxiredoxin [Nitrososphaeria archaeon]MDW7985587.1 peroxiredoxin [Nitrososphaerota archaeon]